MSAPVPASTLDGHCSAIDDNVLYVLSSDSFQSLPLKENATWSTLPMGEAVTGPACVHAVPGGDESQAAMYVIGGTSNNSSYQGLQRYTFSTNSWETLTPTTSDMVDRTSHSAAYLNDTQSILVYAGSRPDAYSELSSQTFVIGTSSPFNIRSFTSKAPPANEPILLPWASDTAVMVGGSTTNTEVWTFNPNSGGWNETDTSLANTIATGVRGTLIFGEDGSKVLETYDMSVSPNVVSAFELLAANGEAVTTAVQLGTSSKRRRDLTVADWPTYNSTNAPSFTRTDYAVTQDSNGLTVISGGSSESSVNIFNEDENEWVDNGSFFDGSANDNKVSSTASTSASSSATATSTSSSSSSTATGAALLDNNSSRHHMLKVLGITLGVLFGIAAIFIIALLLLRWRKQKKRRNTTYVNEKSDRMSFQDRGASFMKEAGGSSTEVSRIPPNHRFMDQNSSHNSFTIMAGKFGKGNSRSNLAPRGGQRGSTESTRQLVKPPKKSDISKPVELDLWGMEKEAVVANNPILPPEPVAKETSAADKKRSSGWSRYFAPTEAGLPSAYGEQMPSRDESRPTIGRVSSNVFVPPLDFGRGDDGQRISSVNVGSPSFNNSAEDLALRGSSLDAARGQRAQIAGSRLAHSRLTREDDEDDDDVSQTASTRTYSTASDQFSTSDYNNNHDSTSTSAYTPVSLSHNMKQDTVSPLFSSSSPAHASNPFHIPRPPSSNYTNSVYDTKSRVFSRGNGGGFFPSNRDVLRPSSRGKNARSPSPAFPAPPTSSSNPNLGLGNGGIKNGLNFDPGRESTMTVFPRGIPSAYYADRDGENEHGGQENRLPAKPISDMSWLRLDDANRI